MSYSIQVSPSTESTVTPTQSYPPPAHRVIEPAHPPYPFQEPTSPTHAQSVAVTSNYGIEGQNRLAPPPTSPQAIHYPNGYISTPHHATELDAHYWKNMFLELGFGDNPEQNIQAFTTRQALPQYLDPPQHHSQTPPYPAHGHHSSIPAPTPAQYHHSMHATAQQPYGH